MPFPRIARDVAFLVAGLVVGIAGTRTVVDSHDAPAATSADKASEKKKRSRDEAPKPQRDATCNICGTRGKFGRFARRDGAVCPKCKSKERHRLLFHYLKYEAGLWNRKLDVLHVRPNRGQRDILRGRKNLNYVTADVDEGEDLTIDLTRIDQPDASWDVVIVYHLLQTIPDDRKAIGEIYRILRPGGRAFVQVPIPKGQRTNLEDPSITTERGRSRAYGQSDRVRSYGTEGFEKRLEAAGFEVEPVDYIAKLGRQKVEKHRLSADYHEPLDQRIWVLTKPPEVAAKAAAPKAAAPKAAAPKAAKSATKAPSGAKKSATGG